MEKESDAARTIENDDHHNIGMEEAEVPEPQDEARTYLSTRLKLVRSRSSNRSNRSRSYTDGYSHFEYAEDDGVNNTRNDAQQISDEKDDSGSGEHESDDKQFDVQFSGDDDPMNPKNRPKWRKWLVVLLGSGCSLCVTCTSALYTSTYLQLEKDFGISEEVATVGLTTYVCGLALGPMFLAPLSEFYGRRPIYLVAFGMFFIWYGI